MCRLPQFLFLEMFGKDRYDVDAGWRPKGYVLALEGTKGSPCASVAVRPITTII